MKIGFRSRMMLGILIVAFLFTSSLLIYNFRSSREMVERTYISSLTEKMHLQADWFDGVMQEACELAVHMGADAGLKKRAKGYLESGRTYDDAAALADTLRGFLPETGLVEEICFYFPDAGQIVSSEKYYTVCPVSGPEQVSWARPADGRPLSPMFFSNAVGKVSQYVYAYAVPVKEEDNEELGVLCVMVSERNLYYALLAPLDSEGHEEYSILDGAGNICSTQAVSQIGFRPPGVDSPVNRVDTGKAEDGRIYASVQAPFTGYRLLCFSERIPVTENIRNQQSAQWLIVILVFLALFMAALVVSKWMYRPVGQLIASIDQVGQGDFTARVSVEETDEFTSLREHFNEMVGQVDGLMKQIIREQNEKKHAELVALQSQIRPHFMYNTLNTIRFAAILQQNKELAAQLGAFISLLEASIEKKGAFIPLKEEIALVEDFVALQKFRYSDCFSVTYQIEEAAKECYVPCLLLQPVVENAVFHGIDIHRMDNSIELAAAVRDGRLVLSCRDNGQGMDERTVQELLLGGSDDERRRLTGIGLCNVQERLRLYYGQQAWFRITSALGEGTCVEIGLPESRDACEYTI